MFCRGVYRQTRRFWIPWDEAGSAILFRGTVLSGSYQCPVLARLNRLNVEQGRKKQCWIK